MGTLQAHIGKTWKWVVAFSIFALAGLFSPSIAAEWWRVRHPVVFACDKFTLQVPLFWTGDNIEPASVCQHGFVLTKFGATLFGSPDNGSSLSLVTKVPTVGERKVSDLEGVFRRTHPNDTPVPFKLNDSFGHCLSVETAFGSKSSIDVFCTDETRGLILLASGTRHALSQMSTMIR